MAATGWDTGKIYSAGNHQTQTQDDSRAVTESKFYSFVDQFRVEEHFLYRYSNKALLFSETFHFTNFECIIRKGSHK